MTATFPAGEMTRPRLLDLFCGAGGAGMGYHLAGFDVIGVDVEPQPDYPFPFLCADWSKGLAELVGWADAIHASPPCQGYSSLNALWKRNYPMLIGPVRDALVSAGLPYIIENVEGAPLGRYVMLCGRMFGLPMRRHRVFETGRWWALTPGHPRCTGLPDTLGIYGASDGAHEPGFKHPGRKRGPRQATTIEARKVMEMPWVQRRRGLTEAIPPAFTRYLGDQLVCALAVAA